jgi:DeoR/GlpR family transcriptional regulator of sugar metabolism
LTTFERRQRLLALLQEQPGVRVSEIAGYLQVSQGTIRNDLDALVVEGRLVRVRGGAQLIDENLPHSPSFLARLKINTHTKRILAYWAAELVADGDSILLDASSTVFCLARYLHDRRRLRVFTNGIEVARSLARNTSNEVVLLGGVLNSDGSSVTELVSERWLQDLHIKTAFVSCSGFTPETGLTEVHISEAQLKAKAINSVEKVIALIDSSKFGKIDLTPFARMEQVERLFTDDNLGLEWIDRLKRAHLTFTVCNEDTVSTFTPSVA